jgi:hypothetical protein
MNINYVIVMFCCMCVSYVHHVFSENHHVATGLTLKKNTLQQPPHNMPMSKGFTFTFFSQNVRIYKKKGPFF